MAKVLQTEMYVAVDPVNNNNKFWKYERLDADVTEPGKGGVMETGDLRITWGRVGAADPESQVKRWDEKFVAKKIAEKTNPKKVPQYTKVNVIDGSSPPVTALTTGRVTSEQVKKLAVAEIAGGCTITATLVKKLAETNKHELVAATGGLSKGGMDIDLETGMVRTALGVVTLDTVKEARVVLDKMLPYVTKRDTENPRYTDTLGTYLRLVPQSVGYRKGWHTDFINIAAQNSLLDQLETSVELAEQRRADALKAPGAPAAVKAQALFECKLSLVDDSAVWDRIRTEFFATVNRGHSCSHLKPVRVYSVTIPHMVEAFDRDGKKVGNIRELWHGTRVFNILSILKRGFVLPTQLSSAQTTGAMFDNGVYFSAQSTKSLNYSFGYWDRSRRDDNCYMFRADVAMGKTYTPNHADSRAASHCKRNGFDSCWAKAGVSGVQNDEQIVYRTSQSNIKYLVEFDSK